jgi:hypothetical protein
MVGQETKQRQENDYPPAEASRRPAKLNWSERRELRLRIIRLPLPDDNAT